ncbi:MAG: DUF697 domain-containing protein [bacterium]
MKSKALWILVGIGSFLIILLMILSSVLDIGERLALISPVMSYIFYGLVAVLLFVLVLNPLRIILFSPSLSIATSMDKESGKTKKIYKKVIKNIVENNELTEEEMSGINAAKDFEELKLALNTCYDTTIKKRISKIIYNNAKTVMISTAICQNAKLDMYSVVAVNLKMIKEIVAASGFRPSYKNLGKLSINVLTTALVAEGLENVAIEDVLPNSAMNSIGDIPFVKPIVSSILQGTSNGLLTLRIGFVCRKYLFADLGQTKSQIRAEAFKESMKMLPMLISDVATYFPSKIVKLFTKKDETKTQA